MQQPKESNEIDSALIERIATDLAKGQMDSANLLFGRVGSSAPHIVWNPIAPDTQHPLLRNFLAAAHRYRDDQGRVSLKFLESPDFAMFRDHCMLLQPDGKGDFIYDHYGSEIAATYGADLTGHRSSDFGGHIGVFFMALYRATMQRKQIVKSIHEPPRQVFARFWRRLIVPLQDSGGEIRQLAVANLSDNDLRAGLEVVPIAVMVADQAGQMCFANRAACEMFGRRAIDAIGKSFQDFTGFDLTLPETPEAAVRLRAPRQLRQVVVRNSLVVPVHLSIGATLYRDQPFYVISARAEDD